MLLGIALRIHAWLVQPELHNDEIMLVLNVLSRPFSGLAQPLDLDQAAPVPFLWALKAISLTAGPDPWILRLLPLLTGCAALALWYAIGRRAAGQAAAALMALLLGLGPVLIQYTRSVKPYSTDMLVSGLVIWGALRLAEKPEDERTRLHWLAIAVVAVIISLSGVLVLLPASAAVFWAAPRGASIRRFLVGAALLWGGTFLASYVTWYAPAAHNAYLQRYWMDRYLDLGSPAGLRQAAAVFLATLRRLFAGDGGTIRRVATVLLLPPLIIGVVAIWRANRVLGAALAACILAGVGAAAAHLYPFEPRLIMYLAPAFALFIGAGMVTLLGLLPERARAPRAVIAVLGLGLLPGVNAAREVIEPTPLNGVGPLVTIFEREHRGESVIYVSARSIPDWVFYTTDWSRPDTLRARRLMRMASSGGVSFRNAPTRWHSVVDEGTSLRWRYRSWTELFGVPTGQGPDSIVSSRPDPDPGWGINEVDRLVARPEADRWILLSLLTPSAVADFRGALGEAGGVVDRWETRGGAILAHVRFPNASGLYTPTGSSPRGAR